MQHVDSLRVRGFRAFRDLTVEGLGRVNLITGKNNTGKSSLLEALRILLSGDPFIVVAGTSCTAARRIREVLRYS